MDTITMNSEHGTTSKQHVSILNFTYKIDFRRGKKCVYQILVFTIHGKT